MHPEVSKARARRAGLHARPLDDPELVDAQRDLNAAKLQAAVLKALAAAPKPTDEQLQHVATLLLAGGAK